MANHIISVRARPLPIYRGGTPGPVRLFYAQSTALTKSWGSEPASAEIIYIGGVPVTRGQWLDITIGNYIFYGNCISDKEVFSSSGSRRVLNFVDNREFLDWDNVYAAFNIIDESSVNGRRVRRYKHLLPANYNAWLWTWTDEPYSAAVVLNFIFNAATVEDPWTRVYHADQAYPVYDLDWTRGVRLRVALQEISDQHGLVFTNQGARFRLEWVRKGEGLVPDFPATSDDREIGVAISGNPTRVRVIGSRNQYQVHGITMQKDWVAAWEAYYDQLLFEQAVWASAKLARATVIGSTTYPVGTRLNAVTSVDDPDQVVTRQLAKALALEITVAEFAALLESNTPGTGTPFLDYRKFQGVSRVDMPAILYINNILFRAFRFPSGFTVRNWSGYSVPIASLDVAQKMIAKVSHDPVTGAMTWDVDENPDGNGYAIVKGYQVGRDLFETIRPERFDMTQWMEAQDIWQRIPFQVDESGESEPFILFEEPVIKSDELVEVVDSFPVFKANPAFTTPEVKLAICFQAEPFSYVKGTGTRDDFVNVNGIYGEFVGQTGVVPAEVTYLDGLTASQKADRVATIRLGLQYEVHRGSFKNFYTPVNGVWPNPYFLTGVIDRINVEANPGGVTETVMLTNEAGRANYIPERELDRRTRERDLLPGQAELRQQARYHRLIAAAVNRDASARKLLTDAFKGNIGNPAPSVALVIKPPQADATLPAGTPLTRTPGDKVVRPPAETTDVDIEIVGITTREGEELVEDESLQVPGLLPIGEILARVQGPCSRGNLVGLVAGEDYLSATDYHTFAGVAMAGIEDAEVKLIRVQFGSADFSVKRPTVVREYLHGLEVEYRGNLLKVLKPWHLRPVVEWEWPSHKSAAANIPAPLPAGIDLTADSRMECVVQYLAEGLTGNVTIAGELRGDILVKFPTLTARYLTLSTDDGTIAELLQEIWPRYRGENWIEGGDEISIMPLQSPVTIMDEDIVNGVVTPIEITYTHMDMNTDARRWESLVEGRPVTLMPMLNIGAVQGGANPPVLTAVQHYLAGNHRVFYFDPSKVLNPGVGGGNIGVKWEIDGDGYLRVIQVPTSNP